ncbi:MAG: hypothetical protein J1F02_11425 [Lachnospiraceae bacterium]|nr:hypothetical protein [Lachnospiraceae bacterium]
MKNKVEVIPICFDGLDCVDNTILTVCNAVRGEYLQTFWNAWNLKFIQAFIHDRRTALSGSFISDNVKEIYGLVFQPVEHAGARTGLLKKYFSEDGLVIMGIKTNCCPWQVSYKSSTYNLHYVIVSEVVEKGVLCVDTMPQKQGELITWEDVEEGIFSVIRVCDKGKETDSAKSVSLKKVYKNVRRNVRTGLISKLITALEKDFYLYLELERNEAVWKVPLYCLFNMASGSHIQFFPFSYKVNCKGIRRY